MPLVANYKHLGLLAFTLLVVGLIFVILKWPQTERKTFSQHIAISKQSIFYYIVLFSITLPLLILFFVGWFVPTFQLPTWFTVFISLASIAQLLATLVPETYGWKIAFHRFISGLSGVLLIPTLALLFTTEAIGTLGKVVALIGIIIMAIIISLLVMSKKETFTPTYVHQSVYYAAFFVPILIISYF